MFQTFGWIYIFIYLCLDQEYPYMNDINGIIWIGIIYVFINSAYTQKWIRF